MVKQEAESDVLRITFAGIASICSQTVTHPVETIKTRMQIMGEKGRVVKGNYSGSFLSTGRVIVQNEKFLGLYKGIQAAWARESIYSSLRLGLYEPIKNMFGVHDKAHTPFHIKFISGAISGLIGSFAANPTDVLKIRLQALESGDTRLNYQIRMIYKNSGVLGFYRGLQAAMVRAMVLNSTKLSSYDQIKHTLLNFGIFEEGKQLHFLCSVIAGFIMACSTAPFDIARTRLMNQPHNKKLYNGLFD